MDRSPPVYNDPSAFTGPCITIGMLAQSLASGIIPVLASSVSVLMRSLFPTVLSKQSLGSNPYRQKKKKRVTGDNKLGYRERDVLCKNLPAFRGLDSLSAGSPVAPRGKALCGCGSGRSGYGSECGQSREKGCFYTKNDHWLTKWKGLL